MEKKGQKEMGWRDRKKLKQDIQCKRVSGKQRKSNKMQKIKIQH
jgi:hypothetical protein